MKLFGIEFGGPARKDVAERPARATRSLPPFVSPPRRTQMRGQRSFEVGQTDRLTQSWTRTDLTMNQAMLKDMRLMRARSRDFARNNEFGRKFFNLVRNNVVGPAGFTLKVDARREDGSVDKADSDLVRAAYLRWAKMGQFEVTGKLSENQFDALAVQMVARDGEVLIRKVEGRDRGIHGCQLQLLPAHLLDEELNRDLAGGNRIRMGVEFDSWMKPVAYWLRVLGQSADMHGHWSQRYDRVSADEIIHLFIVEEAEQWRGLPWAYAAMRRARQLDQFDEAALVAANVGASKMGFFQQKDPEAGAPIASDDDEEEGENRDFTSEAAPGQFDVIPDGYELQEWNPDYPHAVYDPFVKAIARTLSTGLLVSYHGLTGDLTQVNFSSIRSGTLDEREMWKQLQGWYIETVKEPVFSWWLARALIADPALRRLPFAKFDKFNSPVFFGRRWDWVDPKSDIAALKEAVALGVKSRGEIIRERGRIPDDVWSELEEEEARGMKAPGAPQPVQADAEQN